MKYFQIVAFSVLLVLLSLSVLAVGVSPAGVTLTFQPNLKMDIPFSFRSNMDKPMYVLLALSGDLAQYATLNPEQVYLQPGQMGGTIVSVSLPSSINTPGWHYINLIGTEAESSSGTVGARGSVQVSIRIFVQYPGKYLVASLNAQDTKLNGNVPFAVSVSNYGTDNISNARASIDIYNGDKKVGAVDTNEMPVAAMQTVTLAALWPSFGNGAGTYRANATVNYDGNFVYANDTFRIGTLNVEIVNFTDEVVKGVVNKFYVDVKSDWNDPIQNLFADVSISGKKYGSASDSLLNPFEMKNLSGFFDATSLDVGEYPVNIVLAYPDPTTGSKLQTLASGKLTVVEAQKEKVVENTSQVQSYGGYLTVTNLLIVLIVILLIINIFALTRRKKDDKKEDPPKNAGQSQGEQDK